MLTFSKLICAQIDYLKKVTVLLDMFDILYQTQGDFLTFPTHTDHGNLCVHAIDRSCVCIRMYNQTLAIHLLVLCLHMIADVAEGGYPGESDKSAKNRMNSGKGVGHTIILKCGVGKCVPLCIVVAEGTVHVSALNAYHVVWVILMMLYSHTQVEVECMFAGPGTKMEVWYMATLPAHMPPFQPTSDIGRSRLDTRLGS